MSDGPNDPEDPKDPKEGPWWQEAVRDFTLTGLAAFFMTEESVRNLLREKKFPKELVSLLLDGVNRKKEDFYALLAKEFGKVLGKIDLSREMEKFLERHDVLLDMKVSFERKRGHHEHVVSVKEKEKGE